MKTALTIAGSDCSGGAGIQADVKTMVTNGVFAMSAITALTAQNTLGVSAIMEVTPRFLEKQLDSVFTDIYPDAVKIGMVSSPALIEVIAERLTFYKAKNIVLDPVMIATSGSKLLKSGAADVLTKKLFPLATIITPNIPEAEVLAERSISSSEDMQRVAKHLYEKYGCNVLLKGGHNPCDANDVLYTKSGCKWVFGKRINNPNTHGTGCTLSSAIASNLAKGYSLEESVCQAKEYLTRLLKININLGKGSGPLAHGYMKGRTI